MRMRIVAAALLMLAAIPCAAQRSSPPPALVPRHSIGITGGWGFPLSHDGLTTLWGPGPTASAEFLTTVSRGVALGFDIEGSGYWFRGPKFVAAYPSVPFRNPPVAQIVAGVVGRLTLTPGKKLSPYLGAMVGLSHMTGAEYRLLTDSTRKTLFYLPFQTRLATALIGGLEFRLSRSVALDLEGRALYVHNDPDVGLSAVARGGIRFLF